MNSEELREKIDSCDECYGCKLALYGEGDVESDIMLIGDSPSNRVEYNTIIFGGKSKEIFYDFVDFLGIQNYYLTNLVKCYTPGVKIGDHKNCYEILKDEIEMVKPKCIITFGKNAAEFFDLDSYDLRGFIARPKKEKKIPGVKRIITVYHPMYVVYNGITYDEYMRIAERVKSNIKIWWF